MPLFVLPFDHRATFAKELLGFSYPRLTPAQKNTVRNYKRMVWEGFLKAHTQSLLSSPRTRGSSNELAILVDEEFGTDILKEAKKKKIPFALSVEKSGQTVFDFEYGKNFGAHLKKWKPTYAKALVRYNVTDTKANRLQNARLKILSTFCKKNRTGFMLELLMTGDGSRFAQLKQTMQEMIATGIFPTVWKVEGLNTTAQWRVLRTLTNSKIIVLGRGEAQAQVEKWLIVAAKSRVVDGFAVGRTVFFKPLQDFRDGKIPRAAAVSTIAANYLHFIALWRKLTFNS